MQSIHNLENDAYVTTWDQGVYTPSSYPIEALLGHLDKSDFGVFIFAPNDTVQIKGKDHLAVRDNVVFELGLFIGRLSRERNFVIVPKDEPELHLLTDLAGLTVLYFDATRPQDELQAALTAVCNQIRTVVENLGSITPIPALVNTSSVITPSTDEDEYNETDCISLLSHWLGVKKGEGEVVERFSDVDKFAEVPPGTAKKYLEAAAQKINMPTSDKGNQSVKIDYGHQSIAQYPSLVGVPHRKRPPI